MLSLVVRGSRYVVARAAAARQIPFAFIAETPHGETVGHVSEEFHDRVTSWFHEENVEDQEGQQVPGTLLLFRTSYVCTPFIRPFTPAPESAPIPGVDDARVPPVPEIAPESWSELNRRANNILYGSRTT